MRLNKVGWTIVALTAGAALYFLLRPFFMSDEDRPPIIVQEGSLVFTIDNRTHNTSAKWQDKDGTRKKWQPRQRLAKDAKSFTVSNDGTGGTCSLTGARGELVYTMGGSTFTYTVSLDADAPGKKAIIIVTPEVPSSSGDEELKFHSALSGNITQLLVEGNPQPCNFDDNDKPKLTFRFNY